MIKHWLGFTRRYLAGEDWTTFLPLYGYKVTPPQDDDESEEEAAVSDEEDGVESSEASSLPISEDAGDSSGPDFDPPEITWAARDMMLQWLQRARTALSFEGAALAGWHQHLH